MRFSALDGRAVGIWGVGRETRSFATQLAARLPRAHIDVVVLDDVSQSVTDPELADAARVGPDAAVDALSECDVLIRSPGVSVHRPELQELSRRGLPITTATGLWLAEREGHHVIGVTGTKGKSTSATILHHLSAQSRPTHLAGNIGIPALDLLDAPADDWVVLELSSYQIADLPLAPEVGMITNLYREHINWHGSEQVYRRDKLALFTKPGMAAAAYHPGDPEIDAAISGLARTITFGTAGGWHVLEDLTAIQRSGGEPVPLAGFALRGAHNAENLCAALAVLEVAQLEIPLLPEGLEEIQALPHRLQPVHQTGGVEWVDDSISTTPESTLAALGAYPATDIVLIAGGQDREQDYRGLARAVVARGVTLITLPLTGARLAADARAAGIAEHRLHEAADMEAAVSVAGQFASDGSVVLLSPAGPSYHAYVNFEQRGDHFAELARGTGGGLA